MNLTDEPLATVDLGNFESNIDRAIDELFVHKGAVATPPPEEEAPATAPPTKVQPAPQAAPDLLQGLKESLLSLDWEISPENIQKFERDLDKVRERLGQDRHSLAVVKMALGVCKYLRAMKYSASAVSIQFLHSATRTLDLLQKRPQLSPAERRDLMDKMLTKFRRLKAEVQRMKAVKAPELKAPPPLEPELEQAPEPLVMEEPQPRPAAEEEPILELEPLPEVEEAAPEPELVFPEEKEEPLLGATDEDIELPAEEEELVFSPEEEKPIGRFREDTLELPAAHEESRFAREPEREEPLMEIEQAAPELAPGASAAWLARLEEARTCSTDLSRSLAALGQENESLFGRLLQAVTGKSALQKVADYFGKVHRDQAEKLSRAQQSAARLEEMLAALRQSPAGAEMRALPSGHYGVVSAQLREIQEKLGRLTQTVTRLEEGSPSPPAGAGGDEITRELQGPITLDSPLDLEEIPEPEAAQDIPVVGEVFESQPRVGGAPPSVRQIYLTNVAGSTVGVPVQAVAHVFKISKGKAKAVRKRGYATLADFKAPFRSIKRGLTGPLAEQPVKALEKAKFPLINLSPEVVGADAAGAAQAPAKGIVILSDGQRHGSVLTEDLPEKRAYDVLGFRQAGLPADVIGTATIEGDFDINVLNLDRLLS